MHYYGLDHTFVWTEFCGCVEIGAVALKSFCYHHPNVTVNAFVYESDISSCPHFDNVIYHTLPKKGVLPNFISYKQTLTEQSLRLYFKKGHKGTSNLWSYILKNFKAEKYIHFDSDIVFLAPSINDLISLSSDYDLIGQCRGYRYRSASNRDLRGLNDLVQTCYFLFKPCFMPSIDNCSLPELAKRIRGDSKYLGHTVTDFFDPLMFEAINNKARIYFLNMDDFGGTDADGSRNNFITPLNDYHTPYKIDVGRKILHFSAVGSGYNIYNNGASSKSYSYDQYALDRYSLFVKAFYNKDIAGTDLTPYSDLLEYLQSIDTSTWTSNY